MTRSIWLACLLGTASAPSLAAAAFQVPLDQADPAVVRESLPVPATTPQPQPASEAPPVETPATASTPVAGIAAPSAIEVTGNDTIPSAAFAEATSPYVGRALGPDELRELARSVGAVARARGYVLATASAEARPDPAGVLRVVLDEGRIDAVRVLGIRNEAVDRILQRLVTGQPTTADALERAVLLAGDVPGVTITSSRFVREEGFGILLVQASEARTSTYGQLDNRGSDAIGPIRSTFLGTLRDVVGGGDELSLIGAQTPLQPREFLFLRGRYAAPMTADGGVWAVAGSFGRTHPGGSLRRFDVVGHSYDGALSYQRPLLRRRAASLWGSLELRATRSDQDLAGRPIRDDRLVTLTGTLTGESKLAGGDLRSQVDAIWGLPIAGTTRPSDRLASRLDGDARFALLHVLVDWTYALASDWSVRLGAEAQAASRPLLAAIELGAGGPAFGRAYDYGERTGDDGVLGSFELRRDMALSERGPFRRIQLYAFADGGHVFNLRDGFGGGSLASTGGGVRIASRAVDLGAELAAPLSAARLSSGDRDVRLNLRAAVHF